MISDRRSPGGLAGGGAWGLGAGWNSLQSLKLAGLSQNGVSRVNRHRSE